MLKKLLLLFICFTVIFNFISCDFLLGDQNVPDDTGDGSLNQPDAPEDENTIYSTKTSVVVIKSEDDKTSELGSITSLIYKLSGKFAVVETDTQSKNEHEIVIGSTTRPISAKATLLLKEKMDEIRSDYQSENKYDLFLGGYAVYAEGGSVAIVWQGDASKKSISHFVDKYLVDEKLVLEDGCFEFVPYDGVDEIIKNQEIEQDAAWASAKENYDNATILALQNHLDLFDDRFYIWLAGLYESETTDLEGNVIGGGFYYSESARDNDSYEGVKLLPDLESTSQVLTFFVKSGMLSGVSLVDAIPEEMRMQIIDFAHALQSSKDGYFYHPQWGTSISTSRRSRDCGWGATILTRLGSKPYWNTPSGTSGIYGAPGSDASSVALTSPLSRSTVSYVSSAIRAADVWTGADHLSTLEKWESYLKAQTLTIHINSYSVGNNISSQNAQVKNREKLAIKKGECIDADGDGIAENGYIATFRRIFDDLQCDNGLWENSVSYNSVNGLMKIVGAYSNLGIPMPRADRAFASAVQMVTSETTPDGITDVYNPWVSINALLNNMTNYGGKEQSDSLRALIKADACRMIEATTKKVSAFAREDGSFSYNPNGSPYKSQNAIVAVRYSVEGDVNGGTIAYTGILSSMCDVLEIAVTPLNFADYIEFIKHVDY